MPYQQSNYQDSNYQDSNYPGDGGGSPPPNEDPPFGPPLLWQAVLDDLSIFFDDLEAPVISHGADQNSYYDDHSDTAPMDSMWLEKFGWMPHVQSQPSVHYFDYLTSDVDPEFLLTAYGGNHFVASFGHGQVDVQKLSDGSTFAMTLNGITVFGTWHAGAPTAMDGQTIVVTGGHWTFQFTGFDASHYNGNPPPPPAPQVDPSADAATAAANPEGVAEAHRQALSAQLHQLLDQSGGHATITFKGPNGNETFDLAELVNILDHYHIVATNGTYTNISGGAGMVHSDGNGGWVTEINRAQLVAYETAAFHQLDFLILHEVGHMLSNALSYTHTQFQNWLDSGHTRESYIGTNGFNGSDALWRSESYSNNIAAALENLVHIDPPPHPPGGYDYTGLHG
ncbi:MAG: hypothetical protein E6G92_03265 [Alphaproteobacteria bacterium]|nr:MAG: hypothetical protein E6G92_03265 [Alphaproteobacteria bacterium]